MPEYFLLQLKMMARKIEEFGLHPILGFALSAVVFFMGTIYLFSKVDFAPSVYVLLAISLVYKLSQPERNDFLKVVFNEKEYYVLRALENIFIAIPFAGFLLFYQAFIFAILLMLISILMALVSFKWNSSLVIPTPFYKWPFEFIVGFRNFYYIIPIAYFLIAMAVLYENFNLGLFAVGLIYLLTISFYYTAENSYFVWNYSLSPKDFLLRKIGIAILYSSLLVLPVLLTLLLFFPAEYKMIILLLLGGKLFLAASIFAKYASYPLEIQIPYTVLLVLGAFFPLLLLLLIPYLYWKATQHLKDYLI